MYIGTVYKAPLFRILYEGCDSHTVNQITLNIRNAKYKLDKHTAHMHARYTRRTYSMCTHVHALRLPVHPPTLMEGVYLYPTKGC